MNHQWQYLEHWDQPGAWHMQYDQELLERVEAGKERPTFRLYTWKPWCITLGNFMEAEDQVDLQAARRRGIDVVKRVTGGRAVFHAQELTYTICAPKEIAPWGKTLGQTYDWVAARLLEGLSQIGFQGSLDRGDHAALERGHERRLTKPPCFSSASRSEVVWQGRKLVGSAQRRSRGAFLQHGSILMGRAHLDIVDLLGFPVEQRAAVRAELEHHAVCLSDIPGCGATLEDLVPALRDAFAQHLHF